MPEVLAARLRSQVQLEVLGVGKDDADAFILLLSVSDQTYMSRSGESFGRVPGGFWNQGCWSLVWLMTSSIMTCRLPSLWAASRKLLKVADGAVLAG